MALALPGPAADAGPKLECNPGPHASLVQLSPSFNPLQELDGEGASEGAEDGEEEDEECAWCPGSPTGRQGTDLMARKAARQVGMHAGGPGGTWGGGET